MKIKCYIDDCIWNSYDECDADEIVVDNSCVCISYQERMAFKEYFYGRIKEDKLNEICFY